jgi:hypothetical protein
VLEAAALPAALPAAELPEAEPPAAAEEADAIADVMALSTALETDDLADSISGPAEET